MIHYHDCRPSVLELMELPRAFLLKLLVAYPQNFIYRQDVGPLRHRDGEPQMAFHATGVDSDRKIDDIVRTLSVRAWGRPRIAE